MAVAPEGSEEALGFFKIVSVEERNDKEKAGKVKDRVEMLYGKVRGRYPELFNAGAAGVAWRTLRLRSRRR